MKSFVSILFSGIVAVILTANTAQAQPYPVDGYPAEGYPAGGVMDVYPDGGAEGYPGGGGVLAGKVTSLLPGRMWFEMNLADNGLGYSGTFSTLGFKRRLFQDMFDGRWLLEGQGSLSLQSGGFFGNVGIQRVFTVESAPADVAFSVWYDRDNSGVTAFSHAFDQVGVSGEIRSEKFDVRTNAYFPIGTTDYALGDPTGADCFIGHSIVLQPGIDTALQGFDVEVRLRPYWMSMLNGTLDLGGYTYDSDLVSDFSGVRARVGAQGPRGGLISLEVNHDNRFATTGVLQLGWQFGGRGGAGGHEYSPIGRDLDKTIRNAHIVRYNQELIVAINPATGRPYRVFHVDNTSTTAGDGTAESRYATLARAETASRANDIIFVYAGDGSSTGMDEGITLKDGQLLLGEGTRHRIPIQGDRLFRLCNSENGVLPTITNTTGSVAITMANDNVVRGFNIDGDAGMSRAIVANDSRNGTIDTVNFNGGASSDGILLTKVSGNWELTDVSIRDAGRDGLHIQNVTDTDFRLRVNGGRFSDNARDGINIGNFDGRLLQFVGVRTDDNGRHGAYLHDHLNAGLDTDIGFRRHRADSNGADGIFLENIDGNIAFVESRITNNSASGIHLLDVTNTNAGTLTTITDGALGNSIITGNGIGTGAGINVGLTQGVQHLRVSGSTIEDNGFGILARAENAGTILDTQITNNDSIANNEVDGARFVSVRGASHTVLVENRGGRLDMTNNGTTTGNGISLLVGDGAADTSILNATIRSVDLSGSGSGVNDSGILGNVDRNGQLIALFDNNLINNASGDAMQFIFDSTNTELNRITSTRNRLTNSGDDGLDVSMTGQSLVDIYLSPTTITGSGDNGIVLSSAGDARAQLAIESSDVSNNGGSGLVHNLMGNSRGLDYLRASTFTNNGTDGVQNFVGRNAILSTRVDNNDFSGNGGTDYSVDVVSMGTFNGLVQNSTFGTFTADNRVNSNICLALSTNSFAGGATLTSNSAPAGFVVELDGISNGVGQPTFAPNAAAFQQRPYGTVCEPAIAAQETFFSGLLFPDRR
jgi:hypothetical protein